MSLSLLWQRASGVVRVELSSRLMLGVAVCGVMMLLGSVFFAGISLGQRVQFLGGNPVSRARAALLQKSDVAVLRQQLQERVDALGRYL